MASLNRMPQSNLLSLNLFKRKPLQLPSSLRPSHPPRKPRRRANCLPKKRTPASKPPPKLLQPQLQQEQLPAREVEKPHQPNLSSQS